MAFDNAYLVLPGNLPPSRLVSILHGAGVKPSYPLLPAYSDGVCAINVGLTCEQAKELKVYGIEVLPEGEGRKQFLSAV